MFSIKKPTLLIAVAFSAISSFAHSFPSSEKSLNGLIEVYRYLAGQDLALRMVEQQFPDLEKSVAVAKREFDLAYPSARQKTREKIVTIAGESRAQELLQKVYKGFEEQSRRKLTTDIATAFLRRVSDRSQGKIERGITKQFLHSVVFYDRPESELSDKLSVRFSSAGDSRSNGLDVSFKIPFSWEETQGNTPNTVSFWTSEAGTGINYVSVLIKNTSDKRTKKDIERAISRRDYTGLLPNGAILRNIELIQSNSRHGWYVEFETTRQRAEFATFGVHRIISVLQDGKAIEVGCSTGGLGSEKEKVMKEAVRIQSLCRLLLNSLTINGL
jgi:hypothetical protein